MGGGGERREGKGTRGRKGVEKRERGEKKKGEKGGEGARTGKNERGEERAGGRAGERAGGRAVGREERRQSGEEGGWEGSASVPVLECTQIGCHKQAIQGSSLRKTNAPRSQTKQCVTAAAPLFHQSAAVSLAPWPLEKDH